MRLLWVFPSFEIGGAQRRFAMLAETLGAGYEHVVAALDGNWQAEGLLSRPIERVGVAPRQGHFVSIKNVRQYRRILRTQMPDLLLTQNWGAIEWHLANRGRCALPHIHFEDGFGPDESLDALNPKRSLARRWAFRGARRHFVVPAQGLQSAMQRHWRVPLERLHLIPNGIDTARFEMAARQAHSRKLVIGSVGRMSGVKRFDRLINLAACLPQVEVLLVGDGTERKALEAQASASGVRERVRFVGAQQDVPRFLAQMDIYAITSDTEQMPISLVEAMTARLPVLATNVGDIRLMLAEENRRFVFAPGDAAALVQSAKELIARPGLRHSLGEANHTKALAEYSVQEMTRRYRALFSEVAGAKG